MTLFLVGVGIGMLLGYRTHLMSPKGIAEWLGEGYAKGYCSLVYCNTHDLDPLTKEEADLFEDGGEPCVPIVRLYEHG